MRINKGGGNPKKSGTPIEVSSTITTFRCQLASSLGSCVIYRLPATTLPHRAQTWSSPGPNAPRLRSTPPPTARPSSPDRTGLRPHPESCGSPEKPREQQGGFRGYTPLLIDDHVNLAGVHPDGLRHPISGDAHGAQEFLLQYILWIDSRQLLQVICYLFRY